MFLDVRYTELCEIDADFGELRSELVSRSKSIDQCVQNNWKINADEINSAMERIDARMA